MQKQDGNVAKSLLLRTERQNLIYVLAQAELTEKEQSALKDRLLQLKTSWCNCTLPTSRGSRLASWHRRSQLFPNLIAVQHFNAGDRTIDYVQDDHSLFRFQCNVLVTSAVCSSRLRLSVKGCAEVVFAMTPAYDAQVGYLCSEIVVSSGCKQVESSSANSGRAFLSGMAIKIVDHHEYEECNCASHLPLNARQAAATPSITRLFLVDACHPD